MGEWKLSDNEPGEQFRPVVETVPHPDYNPTTGQNDVALVALCSTPHCSGD